MGEGVGAGLGAGCPWRGRRRCAPALGVDCLLSGWRRWLRVPSGWAWWSPSPWAGVVVAVAVGLAVVVAVAVGASVVVAVGVGRGVVGVGVGVLAVLVEQAAGTVMVSSSRVTAPLRASARPMMVSPVCTVIEVRARMVPWKAEPVPSVAELPTCQKTLQAWAPLVRTTELAESVMSVEEGAWKMQTAFGSPPAFRVSAPPTSSDDEALYTPGASCACRCRRADGAGDAAAGPSPGRIVVRGGQVGLGVCRDGVGPVHGAGITMPGGNPVTAVPGLTPRSP